MSFSEYVSRTVQIFLVLGIFVFCFAVISDGIDAILKKQNVISEYELDELAYSAPNVPMVFPKARQYTWTQFDRAQYLEADLRWFQGVGPKPPEQKRSVVANYKPSFNGERWHFYLLVPDYMHTTEIVGARVHDYLMRYAPTSFEFSLVSVGRPGLDIGMQYPGFLDSTKPVKFGLYRDNRGEAYGAFDHLYEFYELWEETDYRKLHSWMEKYFVRLENGESPGIQPVFPYLLAVDPNGIVRIAMDAYHPESVGAVLIRYFGHRDRVLSSEAPTMNGYDSKSIRSCGDHHICLFDPNDNGWSNFPLAARPWRGPGVTLDGPRGSEEAFNRLNAARAEAFAIPGRVLNATQQ